MTASDETLIEQTNRFAAIAASTHDLANAMAHGRLVMERPTSELGESGRDAVLKHGPAMVATLDELHGQLVSLADHVRRLSLAVWLHCPRDRSKS